MFDYVEFEYVTTEGWVRGWNDGFEAESLEELEEKFYQWAFENVGSDEIMLLAYKDENDELVEF